MSIDTNNITLSSVNKDITYNVSINSFNSATYNDYVLSLGLSSRISFIKYAIEEEKKAVFCIPQNAPYAALSADNSVSTIDVFVFYPYANMFMTQINKSNVTAIIDNIISHIVKIKSIDVSAKNSSFDDTAIKNNIISPLNTGHGDFSFSCSAKLLGEYEKINSPYPFCAHFSNPYSGHYSSNYMYANKAIGTCCSNPLLTKDKDTVVSCNFNDQKECHLYSPDKTKIDSFVGTDAIISTNKIVFELFKSRNTDSTLNYSIFADSVLSFNQSFNHGDYESESELDNSMKQFFRDSIDSFAHDISSVPVSISNFKNRSFISNLIG